MIGGAETLYTVILKYLDSDKFDNYVSCHPKIKAWCTGKFRNIATVHEFTNPQDLAIEILKINPDIIMGTHGRTLYSSIELTKKDYPVIEIVHGSHLWAEHNVWMPKKWTKHVVCVSNTAQRVYLKGANHGVPTSVIINGVDTDIFSPRRTLPEQVKTIGYVGRFLESDKHVSKILPAFKALRDSNAKLLLAGGKTTEIVHLKLLSRGLKIENSVQFFEHTDRPEKYYEQIDLFTVRSEIEGYCNSAAEALACGIPLLCYNFGGILEHVPPGTIAIANNQNEYSHMMRTVFFNPELRKEMIRKGLEFTRTTGSAQLMAKRYENIILSVIGGSTQKEVSIEIEKPVLEKKNIVGVCNYHWHGIATATKNICTSTVNWDASIDKVVNEILRRNPDGVLFSGMCPGFKEMMKLLKKKKPDLPLYAYYHGGPSHYSFQKGLFGAGEANAFKQMIALYNEKVIKKIAVSSPGFDEVLRVGGIHAEFCGNIVGHVPKPDIGLLQGIHIGNWNRHHDHKHTSIGFAAAQLYPNAKVHCLEGYPQIPGLDNGRVVSYPEMTQEKLYKLYAQMTVNLQMSFIETFNISALEMWACGRPVVIGPGNLILVDESPTLRENVICWDHTNPVDLKRTIDHCIRHQAKIIEAQFEMLDVINKQSRARWDRFFSV